MKLRRQTLMSRSYVTGGDAPLIEQYLPEEVCVEPDLVLYGLNKILEYNR